MVAISGPQGNGWSQCSKELVCAVARIGAATIDTVNFEVKDEAGNDSCDAGLTKLQLMEVKLYVVDRMH